MPPSVGQNRRQIDAYVALGPAIQNDNSGTVRQGSHLPLSGRDSTTAVFDVGNVHQVAEQVVLTVSRLLADAVSLPHLGHVELHRAVEQCDHPSCDGGQGRAQIVANCAQKFSPHPPQVYLGWHVLHG